MKTRRDTEGPAAPGRGRAIIGVLLLSSLFTGFPSSAQHDRVSSTLHNLSVSGPGEIRAVSETEICKFCHIPHNAVVPEPLWGHRLSDSLYAVPELHSTGRGSEQAPQPDGSSRLCLSCHDGTVALGDVAGEARSIPMAGAERLSFGRRGFLGTDLSGSHPISFVLSDGSSLSPEGDMDMGLRTLSAVRTDPDVKLDQDGKMQCTTCHDPHSDRYFDADRVPRFWVKPTVEEVCLTCHALR